jgi:fatty acid hydroxylase domain-containing protein 2
VWWTTIITFLVYWGFGMIYVLLDVTNKPKFLRKYKIQPGTNEPIENQKLIKVILDVIFNQMFVGIPFTIAAYYASTWRGIPDVRKLPNFQTVLIDIAICILVEEFGFYYSHR